MKAFKKFEHFAKIGKLFKIVACVPSLFNVRHMSTITVKSGPSLSPAQVLCFAQSLPHNGKKQFQRPDVPTSGRAMDDRRFVDEVLNLFFGQRAYESSRFILLGRIGSLVRFVSFCFFRFVRSFRFVRFHSFCFVRLFVRLPSRAPVLCFDGIDGSTLIT